MAQGPDAREAATETSELSAAGAASDELRRQFDAVGRNPVIGALLRVADDFLAVLNKERQVLLVNNVLLQQIGLSEAAGELGLELGETISCTQADTGPEGCGTGRFCSSCGSAIAVAASVEEGYTIERECALTVLRDGIEKDLYLLVRSESLEFEGERFIFLFLRDITRQQQRAALERIFFHDIGSIIAALRLNCHLLDSQRDAQSAGVLVSRLASLTTRLAREVEIQRAMTWEGRESYQLAIQEVSVEDVIQDLWDTFVHYPAAQGKSLILPSDVPDYRFDTDISLLLRILTSMLVNAFEATAEEGEVELGVDCGPQELLFWVRNQGVIPSDDALHIFQRNFTTKEGDGRGLGTYMVRLFGEKYLRGKASFASSEAEGTVFRILLPRKPFREITSHSTP